MPNTKLLAVAILTLLAGAGGIAVAQICGQSANDHRYDGFTDGCNARPITSHDPNYLAGYAAGKTKCGVGG